MKCLERLVMAHIKASMPGTLDPLQLSYRSNRSMEDPISIAIHTALTHQDKRNTYVRILFIDYSSAFNTIVPSKLDTKLRALGLGSTICNWVLDFLTGRPQEQHLFYTNSPMTAWLCMTPTPSSLLTTPQL
jgi:hypothetical protein